eukprot:PhM_4_TR8419/c3_g1_i4/m.8234
MELYYAEDRCNVAKELGASIRDLYVSLIKNGALSPDDAMLTAYLLWGSDEERTYMTVTMLRRHGQKRFEAHNFATAAKKEGSFLTTRWNHLMGFPYPLLPYYAASRRDRGRGRRSNPPD